MKKRIIHKAQKRRRRNRSRAWERTLEVYEANVAGEEKVLEGIDRAKEHELSAENVRLRAVKRAKEERDGTSKSS